MKKLIATLLTLAMLLSCVPALAGSAGSQSGMTTHSAELAAFEDGNGFIYISGLGTPVNTTPAAEVVSIDPYRILFLAQENAAAFVPATRLIALTLDDRKESFITDDAQSAAIWGDAVYYISAAKPGKVICYDLTRLTAYTVYENQTPVERLYATSEGIVLVNAGGESAMLLGETAALPYAREVAQEYAVYDSFDLYTTGDRGLVAVYDGESVAIDVNVTAWAVLNDQIFYLTDNTGVMSLKCYTPATAQRSVIIPACQNMQRQLTASQNLLFMLSNDNVVYTVSAANGQLVRYVVLPALDSFSLPGNATLESYCIEAVSGQLNVLGKTKSAAAAPTFTFVQSAEQTVADAGSDYLLLTAYTINNEDTVYTLLQPAKQYSLLQYGSRGDAVSAIQQKLLELKYYDYIVDGIYGWRTESCIRVLQADLGLEVTGKADAELQKLILNGTLQPYDPYRALTMGDTGLRVQNMQQRLRDLGYLADSADGIFGGRTKTAVMLFQKEHNLQQTGVADANTLKYLYADSATACSVYIELMRGDSGYRVRELNQRLKDLYYLDVKVSSNYNSSTVAAVKKFQQVAGLKQTGTATPEVQKVLFGKKAPENPDLITLRRGDDNARVLKLQKRLNELGYNCGKPDGEFGRNTEKAVQLFQRIAGLEVTGVATVETKQRLYAPDAPIYVEPTELSAPILTIDAALGCEGDIYLLDESFGNALVSWFVTGEVRAYDVSLTDGSGNALMDEKNVSFDMVSLPISSFNYNEIYTIKITAHPTSAHTGGAKSAQMRFKRPEPSSEPAIVTSLAIIPEGNYELADGMITFHTDSALLWSATGSVHGYTWQIFDETGAQVPGYGSANVSYDNRAALRAADFGDDHTYTLTVAAYAFAGDDAPVMTSAAFRFEKMGELEPIDPIVLPTEVPAKPTEAPADTPIEEPISALDTPVDKPTAEPTPIPTAIPTIAPTAEPVNTISDLIILPDGDYPADETGYRLNGDASFNWYVNGVPEMFTGYITDAYGMVVPGYDNLGQGGTNIQWLYAADFEPGIVYSMTILAYASAEDAQPLSASMMFTFEKTDMGELDGIVEMPEIPEAPAKPDDKEDMPEPEAPAAELPPVEEFIVEPVEEQDPGLIALLNMPYNDIKDELKKVSWFENPDSGVYTATGIYKTKKGEADIYFDFYVEPGSGVYPATMTVNDYQNIGVPVTTTLFTGMTYEQVSDLYWDSLSGLDEDGMGGYYASGYPEQGCFMSLMFNADGRLYSVTVSYFE